MKIEVIKANRKKDYKSKKLRVAAYIRVSTKYEKQLYSFESQRDYYISKILRNSNWTFVNVYEDFGVSARNIKQRVGFNNMIQEAVNGKFDLLLTKSISRFARNTYDSIYYVRLLKEYNVGIFFEEEKIYTLDMNNELLFTVLSSVAQQELENNSNHCKQRIKMDMLSGNVRKTLIIYGYNLKKNKVVICKKEAEIIKRLFEQYIAGIKVSDICNKLNTEKVKSPYGSKWIPSYVYKMLNNIKYTGIFKCREEYKYEDLRIISDEMYYKAIELLRNNKTKLKKPGNLYSGLVRCGFCGRLFGYNSYKNIYKNNGCKNNNCKHSVSVVETNINRVMLAFQNILLENYSEMLSPLNKNINNKEIKNKQINKKLEDLLLFNLNLGLESKANIFEVKRNLNRITNEIEKNNNNKKDIMFNNQLLNKKLQIIKSKLLSIDSFPAYDVSKELIDKLIKYIQFGERHSNNYINKLNCRIVLKINESYNSRNFNKLIDLYSICIEDNYVVLWQFNTVFKYLKQKKNIKVKIVIDKRDLEV